jgi:uncharacterized protein involved in exopolysaccharide biosynthesis
MMRKDISIALDLEGPTGSDKGKNKRPGAFRIGYQGSDPMLVTRVANRLADLYVEQNMKTREGQAAGTSDFLDTQLRDAKTHLDEMEATVSAYKLRHNGELPQQENILSGTLARLQTELEANRDAMNRAHQTKVILESSINAMEASLGAQGRAWEQAQTPDSSAASIPLPGRSATSKTADDLELQLAELRLTLSENHPDVVAIRSKLESLRRLEKEKQSAEYVPALRPQAPGAPVGRPAVPSMREPVELMRTRDQLAGLQAQIKGAETELANRDREQQRILHDLAMYQKRVEGLPVREQEMAQITRDYEVSKENYKSLLDKKMAAGMSLDMERRQQSERFIVLDRAQVPERPFKPQRPKLYGVGVGVGLLLALVVGFLAELRRNVFLGEWELPPGTPVLARLPYIEVSLDAALNTSKSRGWFARGKTLVSESVGCLLLIKGVTAIHSVWDRL